MNCPRLAIRVTTTPPAKEILIGSVTLITLITPKTVLRHLQHAWNHPWLMVYHGPGVASLWTDHASAGCGTSPSLGEGKYQARAAAGPDSWNSVRQWCPTCIPASRLWLWL